MNDLPKAPRFEVFLHAAGLLGFALAVVLLYALGAGSGPTTGGEQGHYWSGASDGAAAGFGFVVVAVTIRWFYRWGVGARSGSEGGGA